MNQRAITSVAAKYGLADSAEWTELGGNVNEVYECKNGSDESILRLTPKSRRTREEVLAEVQFLQYLADNRASVVRIIPSVTGKLVEEAEGEYYAVLFEKAQGRLPATEDWTPDFYSKWGKLLGRLHKLTQSYEPKQPRLEWHEEEWLQADKHIPASQTAVLEKAHALLDFLHRLPKPRDGYGLVHGDLHARNFFIHEGELTAFDFDDSCYSWFVMDIAYILYSVLATISKPPGHGDGERELAEAFLTQFRAGYETENKLDDFWWRKLPDFLKLRRLLLYTFYHQIFDMTHLPEARAQVVAQTRRDIEEDFPITSFDFANWRG